VKKKKRSEEPENHERWLVSYADFITLLFAFFVVMFATANSSEKKQEFEQSVRVNLKLGSNAATSQHGAPDAGAVIAEYLQADGAGKAAQVQSAADGDSEKYPTSGGNAEAADYTQRFLSKRMNAEELKGAGLEVRHDAVGVRVTLAASSVFPAGEFKMKRSALAVLDRLGELLQRTDRSVIVEGHTDDKPVASANGTTNWELASLRATTVVRYLIKSKGLDPKRLAAISYADQKPLVPNDSEENRAKNRRIEILIATPDQRIEPK
jgi:chemotaxis protein MotB